MTDKPEQSKQEASSNPLSEIGSLSLKQGDKEASHTRIRDYVMRGGGTAFGRPFNVGTPTLTGPTVKHFEQKGFFAFESLEKPARKRFVDKFTSYGSARFRGPYRQPNQEAAASSEGSGQAPSGLGGQLRRFFQRKDDTSEIND